MGKAFKWETESFNALPMRCKEMFFEKMTEYMVSGNGGYEIFSAIGFDYDCSKSPIEKIFVLRSTFCAWKNHLNSNSIRSVKSGRDSGKNTLLISALEQMLIFWIYIRRKMD